MEACQSSGGLSETTKAITLVCSGRGLFLGFHGNATGTASAIDCYDAKTAVETGTVLGHSHKNADYDTLDFTPALPVGFSNGLSVAVTNAAIVVYYIKLP